MTRTFTLCHCCTVAASLLVLLFAGCDSSTVGPGSAPAGPSRAFGIWTPGPGDSCTQATHDRYAVVGLDGKLYPTWHPPRDPVTGCTFGHEHGRDPAGSDLYDAVGPIPFGYANEAADLFAPHVGYKIEWENDVVMNLGFGDVGDALLEVRCDVLVELHQGSDGSGAFINPLHELVYHVRCNGGTELHLAIVTSIGHPGEFSRSCEGDVVVSVAPGQPAGAPSGGGRRLIPDRTCVERHILVPEGRRSNFGTGLRESWQLSQSVRTADGRVLASINPYFNVHNPTRDFDPSRSNLLSRPVELCYEVLANGDRARGSLCEETIAAGGTTAIPYDDPRSPFDGGHRDVDINTIRIRNAEGPSVWYTDAFGKNARTQPFPGSIRQFIAAVDNGAVTPSGPSIGRRRPYGGQGVHAPN